MLESALWGFLDLGCLGWKGEGGIIDDAVTEEEEEEEERGEGRERTTNL